MSLKDVEKARKEAVSKHLKDIGDLIGEQCKIVEQMEQAVGANALLLLTDHYVLVEDEITELRFKIRST